MERKQFFILEKDFLNTREVGDLIEALGLGGVGAYMAILIYLRHQAAYTTCYRPISCLPHLLGVSGRSGDRKIRGSGCRRSGP